MDSKNYWDKKIIEWEDSTRPGAKVSFIEKLGSYFRAPLSFRASLALGTIAPHAAGQRILDLGCGSGFFSFKLYKQAQPKHITGIDISPNAIRRARSIADEQHLSEFFSFSDGDALSLPLPEVDITVGLGFLDYLTLDEIKSLFKRLNTKYFFFSFSERKISLMRYIHIIYLLSQRCPKHFYHTREEIMGCVPEKFGTRRFLDDKRMSFASIIHNLPVV